MRVVTPISLVLKGLFDEMKGLCENLTVLFDPSMSYETSMQQVRTVRTSLQINSDQVFPLFTFKKSNLVPSKDVGRYNLPSSRVSNTADALSFLHRQGEIEVSFQHYESDAVLADTFEVLYLNKATYNQVMEYTISMPVIGDLKYFVSWEALDSIEYSIEDSRYVVFSGRFVLKGQFIAMQEVPDALIQYINVSIMDYNSTVLSSEQVTS